MSLLKVNPLATAKGQKLGCELCGKPATVACPHCRVTFYCAEQHQGTDWFGIHEKICQLIGALRTLKPTVGSEEERNRRTMTVQMSQHALVDLCKNEAQKHLVAGNFDLAIPGALQSLRFSIQVYGPARIELVPSYLLLAEANLGLKRFKTAEEFLLYANWSVLKNPGCSNQLKSQLYRNFGRLYASQGRHDEALKQLAQDVYHSALDKGPEHIDTAGGYFHLAGVFLAKGTVENGLVFFDKVVDIWYKFLVNLRHRPDEQITDFLSEAQISETIEMLKQVLLVRRSHLGPAHIAFGEACYCLGLMQHATGHPREAHSLYRQALVVYQKTLGPDNASTKAVMRAIADLPDNAELEAEPQLAEQQSSDKPAVGSSNIDCVAALELS